MSFPAYPAYKHSSVEWLGDIPSHWNIKKFRYVFEESPEKITDEVVGDMLSVSGYRGIEVKQYDDEGRRRTDEELFGYRVVRPGQLVVNTMWLNNAGLGVSEYEGHVSPAYRSYWIDPAMDKRFIHHLMRSGAYVQGYTRLLTGIRPNSLQMGRDDLMVFPVLLPTKSEQTQIARFLDHETARIDVLIEEQQRLIELLKEKRQAVISHAVTKGLDPTVPMKDSGVEWLDKVPAHWDVSPLKYLVNFRSGGTPSKENLDYWDGDIPWASAKDLKQEVLADTIDHITEFAIESGAASLVPVGSILIVVRGMILARIFPVTEALVPMAINQDLKAVIPSERICGKYLAVLLRGSSLESLSRLDEAGHGTKALRMENWSSMELPVPPVKEQISILGALERETAQLDSLIEDAEHSIELLVERRSALISAAVTGKIDVRGWQPPASTQAPELAVAEAD